MSGWSVRDALIVELGRLLGLAVDAPWVDVGGSWTTNLRVGDPRHGAVVVRVHRGWMSEQRLAAEQAARIALARVGLPTVPPMTDAAGCSVHTLTSGRLVEMERFVRSTARMKTPRLLVDGFALLARVHDALADASLPLDAHTVPWSNHIDAHEAAAATRGGADRIRQWNKPDLAYFADQVVEHVDLVASLDSSSSAELGSQIVHGDYWDNNVLFDRDRVAAVLDFGFMAERPRFDDLALPIWFYLLEPGHRLPTREDRGLLRRMVDAYDAASTRPLSEAERFALPLAIARQPAWSVGRWIPALDEPAAMEHAQTAAQELAVAQAVLKERDGWQQELCGRSGPW